MSQAITPGPTEPEVSRCGHTAFESLARLLAKYDIRVVRVISGHPIPGSHFGEPEAGIIGNVLYLREDTPVHSALHEACHYICMDAGRRSGLHTDAGGDYDEENAVCYLSILLADHLAGFNTGKMMQDMDSWGYTFRLGNARRWFEEDADETVNWLIRHHIMDADARPSWKLRQ